MISSKLYLPRLYSKRKARYLYGVFCLGLQKSRARSPIVDTPGFYSVSNIDKVDRRAIIVDHRLIRKVVLWSMVDQFDTISACCFQFLPLKEEGIVSVPSVAAVGH